MDFCLAHVIRIVSSLPLNSWKFMIPWKLGFFHLLTQLLKGPTYGQSHPNFQILYTNVNLQDLKANDVIHSQVPSMLVFKDLEHVYDSHHHSNCLTFCFVIWVSPFSLAELTFFIFMLVVLVAILCFQIWKYQWPYWVFSHFFSIVLQSQALRRFYV